jgi:DNA-binding CsgD family transcriptional regulator
MTKQTKSDLQAKLIADGMTAKQIKRILDTERKNLKVRK